MDLNVASHTFLYFGDLVTNLVLRPFCTSLFFSGWLAGWLSACLAVELPVYPELFDISTRFVCTEKMGKGEKEEEKYCETLSNISLLFCISLPFAISVL